MLHHELIFFQQQFIQPSDSLWHGWVIRDIEYLCYIQPAQNKKGQSIRFGSLPDIYLNSYLRLSPAVMHVGHVTKCLVCQSIIFMESGASAQ